MRKLKKRGIGGYMQPSAIYKKSSFYKFGTTLFFLILTGSIISGIILYSIFPKELPSTYGDALKELKDLRDNLYLRAYLVYIPVSVFIFIGVFAISHSMTKKIIIPLRCLLDYSKVLESGNCTTRPPLEAEALPPLSAGLHGLVDTYNTRLNAIKDAAIRLENVRQKISGANERGSSHEVKEHIEELVRVTGEIDKILEKIRV